MSVFFRRYANKFILPIALTLALLVSHSTAGDAGVLGDYPNLEEVYTEVDELARSHPDMVTVLEYGKSADGRKLVAFRISSGGEGKSEALVAADIHGNEYIGNRVAMGVARRLVEGAGSDVWIDSLLEKTDFWFLPCINPDGYAKTWEMKGAEPWFIQRKNAHGVDLNRNFPMPGKRTIPIQWAGSPDPGHKNYRGPYPSSEPEVIAIEDFVKEHRFFASIDYHSWGGLFIPPKCPDHKCVVEYKKMYKAYVSKQKYEKYKRRQFRFFDTFTGEMEDMLYYEYGAMGVCIEIGMTKYNKPEFKKTGNRFWLFNPVDWRRWVENDVDASLAAIDEAYKITGGVPRPVDQKIR